MIMIKKILWIVFLISFIVCTAKKELLVPVLLDYELYYPDEARAQGLEGSVQVRVAVGEDGKAKDARISKSSGNQLLDSAAVKTAKTFTFSPAIKNGRPIQTLVSVPIEFRLKDILPDYWLTEVKVMQHMIKSQYNKEWIRELYDLYKKMIYLPRETNDMKINDYIKLVVDENTAKLWDGFWPSYPANILLFIDIIIRYPESFTSLQAKADFNNYFKNENIKIKYILTQPRADTLINRLLKAVDQH